MEEVDGSIPSSSTPGLPGPPNPDGYFLGGLIAGEGCFSITGRSGAAGSTVSRFVFSVAMSLRDRPLLERVHRALGVGAIYDQPARRATWQPSACLTISSLISHHRATIPFCDRYLLAGAKRRQYETWRTALLAYDPLRDGRRRRRGTCSVTGCDREVRGRGLCRRHYYRATGY